MELVMTPRAVIVGRHIPLFLPLSFSFGILFLFLRFLTIILLSPVVMQKVSPIAWRLCRGAFRRLLIFVFAILLTLLASLILGIRLIAAQFGRPFSLTTGLSLCLRRPFSLCLVWLIFVNVYNLRRCRFGSTFLGPRRIAAA